MRKIKKIINSPEIIVSEVLDGIVLLSNSGLIRADSNGLRRKVKTDGKVGLVIGGGLGHEPLSSAFVGPGLADPSVAGAIFAAPSPDQIAVAAPAASSGKGALFVYGNYAGDVLKFDVASEMLADEGIVCRTILVADDAAIADQSGSPRHRRRGVSGQSRRIRLRAFRVAQRSGGAGRARPGQPRHIRGRGSAGLAAAAMATAARDVRNRGKVAPGDKPMVDALVPAVEALDAAADQGVEAALLHSAAADGAEATRRMTARMGRARNLGERGVGFIDPGALSVAIIFEGLAAKP